MRMLKTLAAVIFAAALPCLALAQTSPNLTQGQVLTAGQWNNLFASKQDTLGFTPMNAAGGVFLGRVVTAPPGATTSGLNLTPGTAPGSPANGDIWVTTAGFFGRANGVTFGPFVGAGSGTFAATSPIAVTFPSGVVTYACATCGLIGSPLSQFAATTSAQFLGLISDETGSGLVVGNNGPTFVAPNLGTPASGTLTNATGLPTSGLTGTLLAAQEPAHTGDVANTAGSLALTIQPNAVTNAKMAQAGAATLKGNPTGSTANVQDFTIQGLTARGAPDANNDKIPVYDNAAGTIKYVTPGLIASSATAGVSSLNGLTGAVTFDSAFCNTVGYIIVRLTGAWTCSNTQPVNARWLGATGNNSTDDTTALQNCINVAEGLHGACYIPAGQYKTTAALVVTSHINIFGDGVQSVAGLCAIAGNCSTVLTAALAANATTILPSATNNAINASTNDAIQIHDLQIVYPSLPTVGGGITAIQIAGTGGSFGTNGSSHIRDVMIAQADIGIQMNDAMSFWIDHSVFYNFLSTVVSVGGTGIAGGSDWNFQDNYVTTGPSTTTGQCIGVKVAVSAAPRIDGNFFNYNVPQTSGCIMVLLEPSANNTSIEPVRINNNSFEGNGAGIVFFNACASPTTCLVSQVEITGNQMWIGGGFNNGPDIITTGSSSGIFVDGMLIASNIMHVVGGTSPVANNNNIIFGAASVENVLIAGNYIGNTSGNGSTSIASGASNGSVKASNNYAPPGINQNAGTGTSAPFTLACGALETNSLFDAVQVNLVGGTGVTAIAKNGSTIISQSSAALTPFSMVLNVGETMQLTCSTAPTATYAAFNP